ncbi:MAG TPA: alpha-L-arabinofuranosidase C-terminal domain-containing protein [Chitinophagaceae bacterium]|jgi:alpha-N-arabinofuranosidase|nr:alpha-L-arabinofuranosidase C-terminal domain-containing protein [Chitinophagaceae bacterium]
MKSKVILIGDGHLTKERVKKTIICLLICCICLQLFSQRKLTVIADKPVTAVAPTMWGVFFEDINFGADGGLYAELVKNRSFEFPIAMMGWDDERINYQKGSIVIINKSDNSGNSRFARVGINNAEGNFSLTNEGFRGMGFHKEKQYDFCMMIRAEQPNDIKIKIQLLNYAGKVIGNGSVENFGKDWKKYSATITTNDTAQRGRLNLVFEGKGVIDIDMISLFPHDTWKNRPGGLRNDLVQKIADLKPGFVRFPGGCIVEGRELTNRYQWKTTVGNVENRKLIMNRWNVEFPRRAAPDYYQTFGLGFYEYFLLSEDAGAEPLPILNCGMACQFNSAEVVAMDELQPYINDALDLIEFANGSITTKWGKLRNEMGHPAPFNLKFIGVGNEQWEPQYIERYKVFEKAILSKYPDINIVSGAGPYAEGEYFNYAWKELKQLRPSLIDEHYYKPPKWFFGNASRYDNYERTGPKVFAGEYAAHSKDNPDAESRNNWESALAEAAFMTGLERNADIVQMCSYAPLFAHVDAWQWRPDLIWFDNLNSMSTPNYYVQKLFSTNRGTHVVAITENDKAIAGEDSLYSSAVIDKQKGELIIKIVNSASTSQQVELDLRGCKLSKAEGVVQTLAANDIYSYNKVAELEKLKPDEQKLLVSTNKFNHSLPPYSVTVLKIPVIIK